MVDENELLQLEALENEEKQKPVWQSVNNASYSLIWTHRRMLPVALVTSRMVMTAFIIRCWENVG